MWNCQSFYFLKTLLRLYGHLFYLFLNLKFAFHINNHSKISYFSPQHVPLRRQATVTANPESWDIGVWWAQRIFSRRHLAKVASWIMFPNIVLKECFWMHQLTAFTKTLSFKMCTFPLLFYVRYLFYFLRGKLKVTAFVVSKPWQLLCSSCFSGEWTKAVNWSVSDLKLLI